MRDFWSSLDSVFHLSEREDNERKRGLRELAGKLLLETVTPVGVYKNNVYDRTKDCGPVSQVCSGHCACCSLHYVTSFSCRLVPLLSTGKFYFAGGR